MELLSELKNLCYDAIDREIPSTIIERRVRELCHDFERLDDLVFNILDIACGWDGGAWPGHKPKRTRNEALDEYVFNVLDSYRKGINDPSSIRGIRDHYLFYANERLRDTPISEYDEYDKSMYERMKELNIEFSNL